MVNDTKFVLNDRMYTFGKKLAQIYIPALSSLYFGLGSIWGLPAVEKIVGTLAVLDTFLGVMLGISSKQYDKSGAEYDGTVNVIPTENGTTLALNLDPEDLVNKDSLKLKVASK